MFSLLKLHSAQVNCAGLFVTDNVIGMYQNRMKLHVYITEILHTKGKHIIRKCCVSRRHVRTQGADKIYVNFIGLKANKSLD